MRGIVEADEAFVLRRRKGARKLGRKPRRRDGKASAALPKANADALDSCARGRHVAPARHDDRSIRAVPAFAFDTHKAVRTLIGAGMQEAVAEAVVDTMNDAVAEGVATKADLAKLEVKLDADIAKVNSRLDALGSRLDTMQWALGLIAAVVLLMAGRLFGVF